MELPHTIASEIDRRPAVMMPGELLTMSIADMNPGDYFCVRPIALHAITDPVTHEQRLYLDSTQYVLEDPRDKYNVLVELTEVGYVVDLSLVAPGTRWIPDTEDDLADYGEDVTWLPVARLIDNRTEK